MKIFAPLLLCTLLGASPSLGMKQISVEPLEYTDVDGFLLEGYKSMPVMDNMPEKVPAVVIIPDWDGVNSYEQQRSTLIAELGYVGFAADIYGISDHFVEDMGRRRELVTLYRSNVTLFVQRIKAAVNLVKTLDGVDPDNVAVIGYCFGGTGVLDYALTGQDDVKALVSFHGGLSDIPDSDPTVGPKLLVLSGGDDDESSDIMDLEDSLSLANASWEITRYSGIEHAFTVFSDSRYNVWADVRSWYSMNKFLSEAFGLAFFDGKKPDMFDVMAMNYTDVDGAALTGYYTAPDMMGDTNKTVPTVVILPDWDGVNTYEKDRATLLAMSGYAAFAADIYGSDLQENLDFPTRIAQSNLYRNDPGLFNQRIQTAIDLVKTFPEVDSDNIAVIGYCFGGTGVMEYAFSGSTDVKVIASFHGGHQMMPQTPEIAIAPYVLVLSGGIDDAHGNQTEMEAAMNARNASWEITRYAKVDHGYTSWYSGAYNLMADARSWDSMMSTFAALMPVEGNMMVVEGPEFEQVEVPNDEGNLDDDSSGAFSTTLLNVLVASALTLFLAALM